MKKGRLAREQKTVASMIRLYCSDHHHIKGLCEECRTLHNYSQDRLERCPYQDDKPTCKDCTIHCYQKEMKEKVREVMRYAGPRMIFKHPVLALWHLIDGKK